MGALVPIPAILFRSSIRNSVCSPAEGTTEQQNAYETVNDQSSILTRLVGPDRYEIFASNADLDILELKFQITDIYLPIHFMEIRHVLAKIPLYLFFKITTKSLKELKSFALLLKQI